MNKTRIDSLTNSFAEKIAKEAGNEAEFQKYLKQAIKILQDNVVETRTKGGDLYEGMTGPT